jgi:lambda family phage portal protein
MLEGGEALIRLRYRRVEDGLPVALQIQVLEAEHLPTTMNRDLAGGNVIRAGIEFDRLGRRVAYHLYRSHPNDGLLAPMSSQGGMDTVRVDASEVIHLFRPLRPGQIRGEPWLTRALVKLNELDQYDDAELVRKKTAAMFAGFITRMAPEDNLMGESAADANGVALAGMEPGTLQILEPGEDIKFSAPADVGSSYAEFMRQQFRAVAAAMGITYEMLTGDLTQVNYSSIRAGLLEFRRRCEALQHGVIVHQLCRPIWRAWMDQAVLEAAIDLPGYRKDRRTYQSAKWIPQGWSWVDPQKEFNAMKLAIRAGLMSRSEAISGNGYDAEDVDREIAADNTRADALGLVFDSDARHDQAPVPAPSDTQDGQTIDASSADPTAAPTDNQDPQP